MRVRRNQDKIEISFIYRPHLVAVVKSLEGRRYHPRLKLWTIPLRGCLKNLQMLNNMGFNIDQTLWDYAVQDKEQGEALERLSEMNDADFETHLPLYPFQKAVTKFMVESGACLNASGVRTGKTIETLAAIYKLGCERTLVVVPGSVLYQWQDEVKKFLKGYATPYVVAGTPKERERIIKLAKSCSRPFVMIVSYDVARIDLEKIQFSNKEYNCIVADEAHRLSNPSTKRYKALMNLAKGAEYRFALTATPLMNRPPDVWGILNWVTPGSMGDRQGFLDYFTVRNQWGGMLYPINVRELAQKIKRYTVRRTLEEVAPQLPRVTIENIAFDLSPKERSLYNKVRMELLHEIDSNLLSKVANPTIIQQTLVKMLVLLQLTCSLEMLSDEPVSTKLDILKEKLEDVFADPNIKVIIFSRFKKMMPIFERELKQYNPLVISGDVNNVDRDVVRRLFQEDPDHRLLVSTDAGGEGLTLNRGDVIFHYDLPYSYGKFDQRNGRVKSLTKERPIMIYNMVAQDSMDVHLSRMIRNKSKISDELLGDVGHSLSKIKEILKKDIKI